MDIKRTFSTLVLMMFFAIGLAEVGWTIYPVVDGNFQTMVSGVNYLYFRSGSSPYLFDKAHNKLVGLNTGNGFSGSSVSEIYRNDEGNWTAVCYSDNNIDIIEEGGAVTNVPYFKDLNIASSRDINDISFYGDKAYIATDYGFAVYDHSKKAIVESCLLYKEVAGAARVGDKLWIGVDGVLYYSDLDANHQSMSSFTASPITYAGPMMPISASAFFVIYSNALYRVVVNEDMTTTVHRVYTLAASKPQREDDGTFLGSRNTTSMAVIRADGTLASTISLPGEVKNISVADSNGMRWGVGDDGIYEVALSDGVVTVGNKIGELNATSMASVGHFLYDDINDRLYIMTVGANRFATTQGRRGYINRLDDGTTVSNVTPQEVRSNTSGNFLRDIYSPVFDPDDRNTYYIGTWFDGIYKFTNNEMVAKYDQDNSPFTYYMNYSCLVSGVQFDSAGNLWAAHFNDAVNAKYYVLPHDKLSASAVTADDWISINSTGVSTPGSFMRSILSRQYDVMLTCGGGWNCSFNVIDCQAALSGTIREWSRAGSMEASDGTFAEWNYIYCFYEDRNHVVWVGTTDGVFCVDVSRVFDDDFTVTRIIVENGIEGVGNYLLSGKVVSAITSDKEGNMWIGTEADGLYKTNADGTEVIAHYDTSNSRIPDNKVRSLFGHPTRNEVYVGTESGLAVIGYDAPQSQYGLRNATIYPQVVYPHFTGMIEVGNIMKGSQVTVVDASGQTVAQMEATRGKAVWNGCGSNGERVATGIYTILASMPGETALEEIGKIKIMK